MTVRKVAMCGCSHEQSRHKLVDVGDGVMKHVGACEHGCGCSGFHRRRRGGGKPWVVADVGSATTPMKLVRPCDCGGFLQNGAFVHAETCEREQVPEDVQRVARACDALRDALVAALSPEPVEGLGEFIESLIPKPFGDSFHHAPSPASVGPSRAPRPRAQVTEPALDTGLPKGELAILTACAQHPEGCDRVQLTALTGYKKATRNAYIARLIDKGFLLAMFDGGLVRASTAGRDLLGPKFRPLPTGDALRAQMLESLPEGESLVLDVVSRSYPEGLTRDQITTATGYKKATRNAYIGRLAAKKLVDASRGGVVIASKHLFGGSKKRRSA